MGGVIWVTCALADSDTSERSASPSILNHASISLLGTWIEVLFAWSGLVNPALEVSLAITGVDDDFGLTLVDTILARPAGYWADFTAFSLDDVGTLVDQSSTLIWIIVGLLSWLVDFLSFFDFFDRVGILRVHNDTVVFTVLKIILLLLSGY